MTIRAVVFDLGHTIWDITPQPEALQRAYVDFRATLARRLGRNDLPAASDFQRAVRDVLHDAAKTYFMDGPELHEPPPSDWIDAGCRRLGLEVDEALLVELTPPLFATEIDGLVASEGTLEAVADLAGTGMRLGCITNTLADTPSIRAMLRRHGIEDLMGSVVTSTEEGWRKPHGSLFEKSLAELGVRPDEAVFVGDSPVHDIGGAKAAGLFALLSLQYVERPYPDNVPQPDGVIRHLCEVQERIAELDASGGR
jgi:HAD superfamily hydrolase (TIGR01549 family)